MAKIDVDAEINSVRNKVQTSTPSPTGAGYSHTFVKADGLYLVDENGVETGPIGMDIGARVYNSNASSIPNNTVTTILFNVERWDTDEIHSTVSNTERLTCKTAGKYSIIGQVSWEENVTNDRQLFLLLNSTDFIASVYQEATSQIRTLNQQISTIWEMEVGDWVEFQVRQTSGGDLDVLASPSHSPEFMMQRIG